MKTFNSKPGLEIIIPVGALLGFLLYVSISNAIWAGTALTVLVIGIFVYLFTSTEYIVAGKDLEIKCGFFYDRFINIYRIKKITAVTDILAAPATSMKRLEIYFDEINSVEISPSDKKGFINSLLKVNPGIEIKLNNEEKKD